MPRNRKLVTCQVMMPDQANVAGNVHGGEIMKMMDTAAGAVGKKYARCNVVTARVDEIQFLRPVMVGMLVTCTAQIAFVGNTSMEIVVTTESENLEADTMPEVALTAYFTMVALDKEGKTKKLCPIIPESDEEKMMYAQAEARRTSYKRSMK